MLSLEHHGRFSSVTRFKTSVLKFQFPGFNERYCGFLWVSGRDTDTQRSCVGELPDEHLPPILDTFTRFARGVGRLVHLPYIILLPVSVTIVLDKTNRQLCRTKLNQHLWLEPLNMPSRAIVSQASLILR